MTHKSIGGIKLYDKHCTR